ncbi:hypothetical protein KY362_01480, partial [Candidatus Woesearchaeota archaeon]|nr:hypothetical protein [Candidatus Woesearchaeota archaeon]
MKAGKHVMEGGLQYIFVYSPHDDVFTALPVPGAKHVAQAVYYHRGDRSISVYELEEGRIDLPNFRFSRILSYRPVSAEKRAQIFETHSIRAQVVGDRKHVLDMIATDVEIFANKEVPKQTRWTSIDSVAELVPNTV